MSIVLEVRERLRSFNLPASARQIDDDDNMININVCQRFIERIQFRVRGEYIASIARSINVRSQSKSR